MWKEVMPLELRTNEMTDASSAAGGPWWTRSPIDVRLVLALAVLGAGLGAVMTDTGWARWLAVAVAIVCSVALGWTLSLARKNCP